VSSKSDRRGPLPSVALEWASALASRFSRRVRKLSMYLDELSVRFGVKRSDPIC
jgi:hypothetical protein